MLPTIELARPEAAPASVLSRSEAASLLGVSVNTVAKLLDSGFLPGLEAVRVTALSGAPQVQVSAGVLPVLRTGAPGVPSREGDDREVIGAGASMTDRQFLEGARQWWRCDAATVTSAGVLAIAVAGWVVGVLSVKGVQETRAWKPGEVRHSFVAEIAGRVGTLDDRQSYRVMTSVPELAEVTARLLGARVQGAVSGGPIAYLAP
ncbi:hypothetical protein ACIQTN_29770 [Streptomyces werraensis]|uniref:hypothetical protein n=1 Tax=Streptomyces werraensis TaxID=68284 RepID=UPI00382859B1